MNAKMPMPQPQDETPQPLTDWRPPGWIVGDEDEPYIPEQIESLYQQYEAAGYYTRGGSLTDKALGQVDEQDARDIAQNRKLLRDAWNTPGVVWRLASSLFGVDFAVDPFWNQGAQSLPSLQVKLDGLSPLTDGMLTVRAAKASLSQPEYVAKHGPEICAELERRATTLGEVPDDFPINWRQRISKGSAAAAANGPHSCSGVWLRCSAAYGTQEFSAA